MKTIGLLGGMSWESTQTYYRLINEGVKSRLGGLHSAKLVLYRSASTPGRLAGNRQNSFRRSAFPGERGSGFSDDRHQHHAQSSAGD